MLKYESITLKNLQEGIDIQAQIFGLDSAQDVIIKSAENFYQDFSENISYCQFWLVKHNSKIIGITGLYSYHEYPQDAWLNWFGVKNQYRRHGFAKKMLKFTQKEAKKRGFDYLRLYTEIGENDIAIKFYKNQKFKLEQYDAEYGVNNILIFSKAITRKAKKCNWDNKNLHILKHFLELGNDPIYYIKKYQKGFCFLLAKHPQKMIKLFFLKFRTNCYDNFVLLTKEIKLFTDR